MVLDVFPNGIGVVLEWYWSGTGCVLCGTGCCFNGTVVVLNGTGLVLEWYWTGIGVVFANISKTPY